MQMSMLSKYVRDIVHNIIDPIHTISCFQATADAIYVVEQTQDHEQEAVIPINLNYVYNLAQTECGASSIIELCIQLSQKRAVE